MPNNKQWFYCVKSSPCKLLPSGIDLIRRFITIHSHICYENVVLVSIFHPVQPYVSRRSSSDTSRGAVLLAKSLGKTRWAPEILIIRNPSSSCPKPRLWSRTPLSHSVCSQSGEVWHLPHLRFGALAASKGS